MVSKVMLPHLLVSLKYQCSAIGIVADPAPYHCGKPDLDPHQSEKPDPDLHQSVNLGMPRNEHFLPRNNGSHSESIPRNLFGTKFRCQPYQEDNSWSTLHTDCKKGDKQVLQIYNVYKLKGAQV